MQNIDDFIAYFYIVLEKQNRHLKNIINTVREMPNIELKTELYDDLKNIAITQNEIMELLQQFEVEINEEF